MLTQLAIATIIGLGGAALYRARRRKAAGPFIVRADRGASRYDFSSLTELAHSHFDRSRIRDAALFLIRDDSIIYGDVYGHFHINRPQPIASATKWLSTAAILTLVDDGLLTLDDPVSWYLPQMKDDKAAITIRQLLACTAGFPSRVPWLKSPQTTLEYVVDAIANVDLVAKPGTAFIYGGVGFQVAGRIAEIATGQPWYRLFRDRIQQPLRMADTCYGIYARKNNRFHKAQRTNPHIGGGVRTTLPAYANLLQMFLDGGVFEGRQVLSGRSLDEMWRAQSAEAGTSFTVHWNREAHYALGGWIDKTDSDGVTVQVSSPGAAGWLPWIDLERRYAGILAASCETRRLVRLYEAMTDTIADILDNGRATRSGDVA